MHGIGAIRQFGEDVVSRGSGIIGRVGPCAAINRVVARKAPELVVGAIAGQVVSIVGPLDILNIAEMVRAARLQQAIGAAPAVARKTCDQIDVDARGTVIIQDPVIACAAVNGVVAAKPIDFIAVRSAIENIRQIVSRGAHCVVADQQKAPVGESDIGRGQRFEIDGGNREGLGGVCEGDVSWDSGRTAASKYDAQLGRRNRDFIKNQFVPCWIKADRLGVGEGRPFIGRPRIRANEGSHLEFAVAERQIFDIGDRIGPVAPGDYVAHGVGVLRRLGDDIV